MKNIINLKHISRKIILKYFFFTYLKYKFNKQKSLINKIVESNNAKTTRTSSNYLKSKISTKKTAFILGSGPSINNIQDDRWENIHNNFSIGFNFWTLHKFVPDVYVHEIANESNISKQHHKILNKRLSLDYSDVDIFLKNIWQGQNNRFSDFIDNTLLMKQFISYDFLIPDYTIQAVKKFMVHYGRYCQKNKTFLYHGYIPQLLSTPFWCTIFLSELGFKEIIFCGVDMYSPDYFFDDLEHNIFPDLTPKILRGNNTHKAFSGGYGYNFTEAIDLLNYYVLQPAGINLFVENPKSLLSQVIPVWDY